mmetsp:Transcript_71032/g.194716  ORF Transcript_71032/g.194716 Transcript_71032/m.194716 type:complete len:295 (-) Transcript_71032:1358-2242(-)
MRCEPQRAQRSSRDPSAARDIPRQDWHHSRHAHAGVHALESPTHLTCVPNRHIWMHLCHPSSCVLVHRTLSRSRIGQPYGVSLPLSLRNVQLLCSFHGLRVHSLCGVTHLVRCCASCRAKVRPRERRQRPLVLEHSVESVDAHDGGRADGAHEGGGRRQCHVRRVDTGQKLPPLLAVRCEGLEPEAGQVRLGKRPERVGGLRVAMKVARASADLAPEELRLLAQRLRRRQLLLDQSRPMVLKDSVGEVLQQLRHRRQEELDSVVESMWRDFGEDGHSEAHHAEIVPEDGRAMGM